MEQETDGVYSRMYQAMSDHKQGLVSFHDMLQSWKEEARLIREQYAKCPEEKAKVSGSEAA